MKKLLTISLAALLCYASPVSAKMLYNGRMGFPGGSGCMQENAQVTISFNSVEPDVTAIQSKFEAKQDEIKKLFKEAELEKFEMQSMNYNVSPQNYGNMSSAYQFNGSMSFNVQPANRAITVMQELIKKGYQASVNVNSYRNGMPCPQQSGDAVAPTVPPPAPATGAVISQ